MTDLIDRQAALDALNRLEYTPGEWATNGLTMCKDAIKALPSATDTNVGGTDNISRQAVRYKLTALVNEFEEILSHIREREVNDSVCGLCEYDGAYIGQSGDWCNECPGFEKDDCFKLKEKYRKEWTDLDG